MISRGRPNNQQPIQRSAAAMKTNLRERQLEWLKSILLFAPRRPTNNNTTIRRHSINGGPCKWRPTEPLVFRVAIHFLWPPLYTARERERRRCSLCLPPTQTHYFMARVQFEATIIIILSVWRFFPYFNRWPAALFNTDVKLWMDIGWTS